MKTLLIFILPVLFLVGCDEDPLSNHKRVHAEGVITMVNPSQWDGPYCLIQAPDKTVNKVYGIWGQVGAEVKVDGWTDR